MYPPRVCLGDEVVGFEWPWFCSSRFSLAFFLCPSSFLGPCGWAARSAHVMHESALQVQARSPSAYADFHRDGTLSESLAVCEFDHSAVGLRGSSVLRLDAWWR